MTSMDRMRRWESGLARGTKVSRGLLALAGSVMLFACGTQPERAPTTARVPARGAEVAAELTAQYNDKRADCGAVNRPAFLCSGILFRGTVPSDAYHSWNPSPISQTRGGVSFSYLRADAKCDRLAYGYANGLIFKPYLSTESTKLKPQILCAFPVDGWTNDRANKGCGAHPNFSNESVACQSQGIKTAQQWVTHFNQTSANKNTHQCGFDVSDSNTGQAAYFAASLAARPLIAAESFIQTNELVIATWAQMDDPSPLPIQAFFYTTGGLAGAQHDQKDYYAHAGTVIPIVAMKLPSTAAKDATIIYNENDQAVGQTAALTIDTSALNLINTTAIQGHQASGGVLPYTYSSGSPGVVAVTDAGKGIVKAVTAGSASIRVHDSTKPTPQEVGYPVVVTGLGEWDREYNFDQDSMRYVGPGATLSFPTSGGTMNIQFDPGTQHAAAERLGVETYPFTPSTNFSGKNLYIGYPSDGSSHKNTVFINFDESWNVVRFAVTSADREVTVSFKDANLKILGEIQRIPVGDAKRETVITYDDGGQSRIRHVEIRSLEVIRLDSFKFRK